MKEKIKKTNSMVYFKKYVPAMPIYCLGISGLYIFGYWSSFNINAFEYIDISNIIMLSIEGLYYVLIPFIFSIILIDYFIDDKNNNDINNLNLTLLDKFYIFIWIISCILSSVSIFIPISNMWMTRAIAITIPLSMFVKLLGFLSDIHSNRIRILTIYLIILIPFFSIDYGIRNAEKIIYGDSYLYLNSSSIDGYVSNKNIQLRYIGKLGDSFLFYNADSYAKKIDIEELKNIPIWSYFKTRRIYYHRPKNESIIIVHSQNDVILQLYQYNK